MTRLRVLRANIECPAEMSPAAGTRTVQDSPRRRSSAGSDHPVVSGIRLHRDQLVSATANRKGARAGRNPLSESPFRYRARFHRELPHVVKFSGGRSSGMLLFQLLEHGLLRRERGDVVVFNNTSCEHPETYRFAAKCKEVVETHYQIPFPGARSPRPVPRRLVIQLLVQLARLDPAVHRPPAHPNLPRDRGLASSPVPGSAVKHPRLSPEHCVSSVQWRRHPIEHAGNLSEPGGWWPAARMAMKGKEPVHEGRVGIGVRQAQPSPKSDGPVRSSPFERVATNRERSACPRWLDVRCPEGAFSAAPPGLA